MDVCRKIHVKLVDPKTARTWRCEFKAIAAAQNLAEVLDLAVDRSTLDQQDLNLDDTKNQDMYPFFQRTLQTTATIAIVLVQESTKCFTRNTWEKITKQHVFHCCVD